ncbi:Histone deacetylase complex subunit [Elasticomyces elasticus]|nr:Histone deacetylase complex subunit [Elasticomyces elasticus]
MPSPRRSLRTTLPPPKPTHSNSSSSLSSVRADRGMRSQQAPAHPPLPAHKPSASHSLSSEELTAPMAQRPQPRRSKRSQNSQEQEQEAELTREGVEGEGGEGEEEVTRCICGQQEYPGLPQPLADSGHRKPSSASLTDPDTQSDEPGSLFIQCDGCRVWQHGGCVGIMEVKMCPDKYYCELCDKEKHHLGKDSKGQRYSRYVPLYGDALSKLSRKNSSTKDNDSKGAKERERARGSVDSTTKRRATMNSRQAVEEEELIRHVIEESKGDNEVAVGGGRKKRAREESDEIKQENKRLRTGSRSPSPLSFRNTASLTAESDDEAGSGKLSASSAKKVRAAAAQTQRQKELEQQEKDRAAQRAEAAGRRQQRAGRRRGDDAEPSETPAPKPASPSSQPTSRLPSPASDPPPTAAPKAPPKKAAGANGKSHKKRLGRNQYSKDRDNPVTESPRKPKASKVSDGSGSEELARKEAEEAADAASRSSSDSPADAGASLQGALAQRVNGVVSRGPTSGGNDNGSGVGNGNGYSNGNGNGNGNANANNNSTTVTTTTTTKSKPGKPKKNPRNNDPVSHATNTNTTTTSSTDHPADAEAIFEETQKRAKAMLEYISKAQGEFAAASSLLALVAPVGMGGGEMKMGVMGGGTDVGSALVEKGGSEGMEQSKIESVEQGGFEAMDCRQMMDMLTREIVVWQRECGGVEG